MSEKQPQIPEGASGMSPERRKSRFPGVLILSVTVGLVMGAVVYGVLMLMTGLDSRITTLEGQRREMLSASETRAPENETDRDGEATEGYGKAPGSPGAAARADSILEGTTGESAGDAGAD